MSVYHRFWNFRTDDPADVALVLNPATRAGMRRKDWRIFELVMDDADLDEGKSARVELEIENPGIAGLVAGARFLIVWEEFGADEDDTSVQVVCKGRISGLPTSLLSGTLKVVLDCRPDDWEKILLTEFEDNLPADIPASDVLPYNKRFLALDDWMRDTWYRARIDPATWAADLRPIANMHDVDASKPAGHLTMSNGDRIYDLTGEILEDDVEMAHDQVPLPAVAGEINIAWNQRAIGPVDLGGVVQAAFIARALSDGDNTGHMLTYSPEPMQSSLPTKGTELAPGVKIRIANWDTYAGTTQVNGTVADVDISQYTSQNYELSPQSSNKVTVRYMGIKLKDGANNGLVADYDYHQPRSECMNVIVRASLQNYALTAVQQAEFLPQPLNDPTVVQNLKPWVSGKNYGRLEIAFFDGFNYVCITAHTSAGTSIDTDKFLRINVPFGVAAVPHPFDAGATYYLGHLVVRATKIYVCAVETVTGAFDANKWVLASSVAGLVVLWQAGVTYTLGVLVSNQGTIYYCSTDHISSFFFDANKFTVAPADILNVALAPGEPAFFGTPRGATSIIWQMVRSYALILKRALAFRGSFTMAYGRTIDGALTTSNIRKGTLFRVRASKLPGGYQEIYGIITSVRTRINGDDGEATVKCGFKVCIGMGADDPAATKVFRIPHEFEFSKPTVLVDTRTLSSPAAHISTVFIEGPSYTQQANTINSIAAAGNTNVEAKIQNALLSNPNRLVLSTRGLPVLELPELDHGAMVSAPMYVPKGIVLS